MKIIDHGKWLPYKPEKLPEGAPANALFARRESDQVDWYDYVNSGKNFGADSVKFTTYWRDYAGGMVVGAAVRDATLLFPANAIVAEITDYVGNDPQAELGRKLYKHGIFTEVQLQAPQPQPTATETKILSVLDAIVARIENLEKKKP